MNAPSPVPGPSIAVVNYAFPVTTQTFHHRRERAMADDGVLQAIHYVKDANGVIEPESRTIQAHAERITSLDVLRALPELRRVDVLRALTEGTAAAGRHNGEGGRAGFVWQALCGLALGRRLEKTAATNIHAVFATAPLTIGLFAALVTGLPLSVEVHTPMTLTANPELLRLKLGSVSLAAVISDYTADRLVEIAPDVPVAVIHCGLDPLADDPTGSSPASDQNPTIDIVAVGSLVPKKGHDVLIEALALLQGDSHDVSAAIVGEGPERANLEALASRLGVDLALLGSLPPDEVRTLRGRARVGVLASVRTADGDEDGIPVALMEFMQEGVPVVGTDVAGIRELLAGGEAGRLVPPRNSRLLADALLEALIDAGWRERAAVTGRERIAGDFDNGVETRRLIHLIDDLR